MKQMRSTPAASYVFAQGEQGEAGALSDPRLLELKKFSLELKNSCV